MRPDPEEQPRQHMNVINGWCTPSGLDPTGVVEGGYLRVSCPVITATINFSYNRNGEALYRLSFPDDRVTLRRDRYESPEHLRPDVPFVAIKHRNRPRCTERTVRRYDGSRPAQGMVDNVIARLAFIITTASEGTYSRDCLVLGPSEGVPDAYERVGCWGYFNDRQQRLPGTRCD